MPDSEAVLKRGGARLALHPGNSKVERINLLSDRIAAPVQDIFSALEREHPQLGLDWLLNLSRHALNRGEEAVLLVASDSAGEFAVLPLILAPGGRANALANFYTSLYHPGASCEEPLHLLRALFEYLATRERASTLTLAPMDPQSPLFSQLQQALAEAGWRGVHDYFCFGNWIHPSQELSWNSYLASRSSRLKNTVERRSRKLLKDGVGTLSIVTGGAELDQAIADYTAIYNSSWKRNEPHTEFTPQLLLLAAARGWLRLGLVKYEGKAIAAQIWLVANGTAYIFKLAYRDDYSQLSPGTVLTAHLFEHVLEHDRVQCIDYLSGDDSYKQDWMSQRRERRGIAAYNPRSGRGLGALLGYRLKQLAKRLRPAGKD